MHPILFLLHGPTNHTMAGITVYSTGTYVIITFVFFAVILAISRQATQDD